MPRKRSNPHLLAWHLAVLLLLSMLPTAEASAFFHAHIDAKHEIEQLEEQWRTAQLAGDVATMDHMLSEDYVGITMSGQVNTKAQQLDRIRRHIFVLTRLDLRDVKVKLLDEVAIVTVLARVDGTSENKRVSGDFRYTRIYHHLPSGQWQITNFEATRIHGHQKDAGSGAS